MHVHIITIYIYIIIHVHCALKIHVWKDQILLCVDMIEPGEVHCQNSFSL